MTALPLTTIYSVNPHANPNLQADPSKSNPRNKNLCDVAINAERKSETSWDIEGMFKVFVPMYYSHVESQSGHTR